MTWLIATLIGAVLQSWRTAVQQSVRASLSINGAGVVRYLFGLPVAIGLLVGWCQLRGFPVPGVHSAFWGWAVLAGFLQIMGTNLMLMAFSYRNFVAGTAYAKTEAIQGAILSWILLGERLSLLSWLGIAIGVAGVILLAKGEGRLKLAEIAQPAALCGLGTGFFFTVMTICTKLGSRQVETTDTILSALVMVVAVQSAQILMQGGYLLIREPGELRRVAASWRTSSWVGLMSSTASACWFTAFALAPVALVRTVGQVEVLLTVGFGRFYLGETIRPREVVALFFVAIGVAMALAGSLHLRLG